VLCYTIITKDATIDFNTEDVILAIMPVYTKTVKLTNIPYIKKHLDLEQGFNADFIFNYDTGECTAIFQCSDEIADPRLRKTKEDLEFMIIRKFGAFILKDNMYKPRNFDPSQTKNNTPITNPLLNTMKADSYKDHYDIKVDKTGLQDINSSLLFMSSLHKDLKYLKHSKLKPFKIKQNSSYASDDYTLRIGQW
jgi:hypothetical protein